MTDTFYMVENDYNDNPSMSVILAKRDERGNCRITSAPDWSYFCEGDWVSSADDCSKTKSEAIKKYQRSRRKRINQDLEDIDDTLRKIKRAGELNSQTEETDNAS